MKKEYILSKRPPLKIVLDNNEFEIINKQYTDESGVFSYSKLYDIEFREKSTDYVNTGFSIVLGIFLPWITGRKMNYRERIRMNYDGKEKKIMLADFDRKKVIEAITEIQKQMNPKYLRNL